MHQIFFHQQVQCHPEKGGCEPTGTGQFRLPTPDGYSDLIAFWLLRLQSFPKISFTLSNSRIPFVLKLLTKAYHHRRFQSSLFLKMRLRTPPFLLQLIIP